MVRSVVEDCPVQGCQSTAVNLLQSHGPHVAGEESGRVVVYVCAKDVLLSTRVFLTIFTQFY
jgi:hypothetical protein